MELRDIRDWPNRGRSLVNGAPIIYYFLEDHSKFSTRYENIFVGSEVGDY